ncbi:MAG: CHAP domain-containing protein [Clostridiales bacterium]|nr:CHAP domain-containing protein [Clostridiales bacterium]
MCNVKKFPFKIEEIQTDNGFEFTNRLSYNTSIRDRKTLFENKLEELGIRHKLIKPYTPRHNGKVERSHRKDQERFYYKKVLHKVYWDMNEIKWHKSLDKEKLIKLHIDIRGKSAQEMAAQYKFNDEQMKMLNNLLNLKYDEQWKEVLRNSDIVKVAETQLGNKGGEPYWSWYGFENRVEWCACFVSWCANQCGYIEAGLIPKFSGCQYGSVTWFKDKNQWQESGYQARSGDIIFFDWDKESVGRDNSADHVGIVEYVDNGRVHTIEGNSGDECCRRDYDINSLDILGYGTPAYP